MALIAWYKLDGNALDSSGNGNHGSETSIAYTAGKIGQGASSGYITIPNNEKLQTIGYTSISFWININSFAVRSTIIDKAYGGEFTINAETSGQLNFYAGLGGGNTSPYSSLASSTFSTGGWHHFVLVRNGTVVTWYKDGVKDTSSTSANFFGSKSSNSMRLRTGYTAQINGNLDDVRIYDHALSEKEIKELAKAKILHYTFDEFQEPTENLLTVDNFLNSLDYHTVENYDNVYPDKPICRRITRTSETNAYYNYSTNFPISGGKSYTFSFYMRLVSTTTEPNFIYAYMSDDVTENTSQVTTGNLYLNYNWQRVELTIDTEPTATSLDRIAFHTGASNIKLNTVFEIANPQLEQKDHATPFVNGTRTGSVSDNSGYDNHADLALATTPQWTSDSRIGKGAYITGAAKFIKGSIAPAYIPASSDYTQSVWVYPTVIARRQVFIDDYNRWEHWAAINSNGTIYASYYNTNQYGCTSTNAITANQWYHVAVSVVSGSSIKLYVNGELWASNTSIGGVHSKVYDDIVVGANGGDSLEPFLGYVDDVRLYATALSADDVKELYNTRAQIDNKGNFYANNIEEPENLAGLLNDAINNKIFTDGLSTYTQSNCQVTLTDEGLRIYRPPNLIYPGAGNTMWGGLRAYLPDSCKEIGKTYKIRFSIKGQTSNNFERYFAYEIGWSTVGIGLTQPTSVNSSFNATNFQSSTYQTVEMTYTVPSNRWQNGTWPCDITSGSSTVYYNSALHSSAARMISGDYLLPNSYFPTGTKILSSYTDRIVVSSPANSSGTAISLQTNRLYDTMLQFKIGFTYTSTGTLGTDLYIKNFSVIDITGKTTSEVIYPNGTLWKEEISEIGPTNGLVAYYPLNGDAKDYANANDGTVNGATISAGINGKACYSFDGNDQILCGDGSSLNVSNFTLSSWIKTADATTDYNHILSKGETGSTIHMHYILYIRSGVARVLFGNDVSTNSVNIGSVSDDSWHLVTGTYDGTYLKGYLDGVLTNTFTCTLTPVQKPTKQLAIGTNGVSGETYTGLIQNVRIYNRALSAEEIKILYDIESLTAQVKLTSNEMYIAGEFKEAL